MSYYQSILLLCNLLTDSNRLCSQQLNEHFWHSMSLQRILLTQFMWYAKRRNQKFTNQIENGKFKENHPIKMKMNIPKKCIEYGVRSMRKGFFSYVNETFSFACHFNEGL